MRRTNRSTFIATAIADGLLACSRYIARRVPLGSIPRNSVDGALRFAIVSMAVAFVLQGCATALPKTKVEIPPGTPTAELRITFGGSGGIEHSARYFSDNAKCKESAEVQFDKVHYENGWVTAMRVPAGTTTVLVSTVKSASSVSVGHSCKSILTFPVEAGRVYKLEYLMTNRCEAYLTDDLLRSHSHTLRWRKVKEPMFFMSDPEMCGEA